MESDATTPRAVVMADLDGTLIHSRRRVLTTAGLMVVEEYEGRDVGFMEPEGWDLLDQIQSEATLVPATARTRRQYGRIRFPQQPEVAILAGGAVVLVDDELDPVWDEVVGQALAAATATVDEVASQMEELPVTEVPRIGDDRFAYVKVAPDSEVDGFTNWAEGEGWRVVHQDGRMYAHPEGISKAAPLDRVAELVGAPATVALGDGLMDRELLDSVPMALTPSAGPLWMSGWRNGTSVDGIGPATTTGLLRAVLDTIAPPDGASPAPQSPSQTPDPSNDGTHQGEP